MAAELFINNSWAQVVVYRKQRPPIQTYLPMGIKIAHPNKVDVEIHVPENVKVISGLYELREDGLTSKCEITVQSENILYGVIV